MSSRVRRIARAIALASLAGDWQQAGVEARIAQALQLKLKDARPLARLLFRLSPKAPRGRDEWLAGLLSRSEALRSLLEGRPPIRVHHWLLPEASMAEPHPKLSGLTLPQLTTEAELAAFLGVMSDELDWFADPRRLNAAKVDARLRHYNYRWLAKRSGAYRLIESPKPRLKRMQRLILDQILVFIPLHEACHGHRRGHGVHSFVAPHAGQQLLIALDLAEFFSVVTEARVRAIFASVGYNDRIARLLAAVCCAPTPTDILRAQPRPFEPSAQQLQRLFFQRQRLRDSHLPQGSPCSPALANLAAYMLDARLSGLADRFGATYTRYADDLALSGAGSLRRALDLVIPSIGAIAHEEGFALRYEKTRVMRSSERQQLCGVVLNETPSVSRAELELLEATLVNCRRSGSTSQNRAGHADFRAHLAGRVAWVTHIHAVKGARLQVLFEAIDWST